VVGLGASAALANADGLDLRDRSELILVENVQLDRQDSPLLSAGSPPERRLPTGQPAGRASTGTASSAIPNRDR
jgi:hypothetical protein